MCKEGKKEEKNNVLLCWGPNFVVPFQLVNNKGFQLMIVVKKKNESLFTEVPGDSYQTSSHLNSPPLTPESGQWLEIWQHRNKFNGFLPIIKRMIRLKLVVTRRIYQKITPDREICKDTKAGLGDEISRRNPIAKKM